MLIALLSALLLPARAGEILVEAPPTMVLVANGLSWDFDPLRGAFVVPNAKAGDYLLELRTAFGKTRGQELVHLGEGESVRLGWVNKRLQELSRGPQAPPSPGLPAQVKAGAQQVVGELEGAAKQAGAALEQAARRVDEVVEGAVEGAIEGARAGATGAAPPPPPPDSPPEAGL